MFHLCFEVGIWAGGPDSWVFSGDGEPSSVVGVCPGVWFFFFVLPGAVFIVAEVVELSGVELFLCGGWFGVLWGVGGGFDASCFEEGSEFEDELRVSLLSSEEVEQLFDGGVHGGSPVV